MSVSENENFMSRWSRRKKEVELESLAEDFDKSIDKNDKKAEGSHEREQEVREKTPEEIQEEKLEELNALTDEDMPDVETLDEDSDYAGFMSINVSESLRKIALQKLFHGKSYNIRDGLDEYDGDYTSFEKLDPSVITSDMKHMIDVEAKKLLAKEDEDDLDVIVGDVEDMDDELGVASNENVSETEMISEVNQPVPVEKLAASETVESHYLENHDIEKLAQEENINNKSTTRKL